MTCPHSEELKGKALHLRSNRHTTNSESLHVAAAVACTGTKQQIQSMFAHHLINTSGSVPGAVLFQGWRKGLNADLTPQCYFCPYIEDF